MTRAEAAQLIELRQILWPNTPAPGDAVVEVDTWAMLLEPYEPAVVAAAMRSKRAEAFAPTLGQLEEAINPTPTYAVAMEEFQRMLLAGHSPLYTAPQKVPWSHPLVRAFAEAGWWKAWGMSPDSSSDPDAIQAEAAFRAHFREGFKGAHAAFVARVEIPAFSGRTPEQIAGQTQIGAG